MMIQSKNDLMMYLSQDKLMLGRKGKHPAFMGDEIWKFQIALRKHEFYKNTQGGIFHWIMSRYWKYQHHRYGIRLGFTIPCNVFGPGLNIHHYGCIVVNSHARVGSNCCIQQGVNIGQNHSKDEVPTLGENVYIGPGAKIFGGIKIANNVAIGANAVVTHSCEKEGVNLVGCPAQIVGNRSI